MKLILSLLILTLLSCSTPKACICERVNYQYLNDVELQELFRYQVENDSCANWMIGDDTKTDSNGYVYNYKETCD